MVHTRQELNGQYRAALQEHLEGSGEAGLHGAYQVGRQAIAEGLGVLQMAAAHQESLDAILLEVTGSEARARIIEQANIFFVESLSPFEMALRGFQEANRALKESMKELRLTEEELRGQNRQLAEAQQVLEGARRRYQDLFDFAPDGYLVTDLDGTILEANRTAGALLGTSPESLVDASLLEFVQASDRPLFQSQLAALRTTPEKRTQDCQVQIRPRSGASFPATLAVRTVHEAIGEAAGLRWLMRDITDRKKAEEERAQLRISEQVARAEAVAAKRFAFLAEASVLLAASLDHEAALANVAALVTANMADWCSVYVTEESGTMRRVCSSQRNPAHAGAASQIRPFETLVQDLRQGQSKLIPEVNDEWLCSVSTSEEHLEILRRMCLRSVLIVPLHAHGHTVGAMTMATVEPSRPFGADDLALAEDLARRCALAVETAQLYHAVTQARDKAEEASRAKDEFLAILGHELRNPLTPILGWVRKFKKETAIVKDSVLKEGVLSLERNVMNVMRLVDDCLDLARISERKISLQKDRVDLNQVVAAAMESVRDNAQSKGLELSMQPAAAPTLVLGDRTRLDQVVTNIVTNAVKFTRPGGRVTALCSAEGDIAEILIQDTGIGIDPGFLEQIFEPFRQGTREWLTTESGLGLGLAIARRLVELHGGQISAASEGPGRGSCFRIHLPLAPREAVEAAISPALLDNVYPAKVLRLLLVEDSRDILRLMKLELEDLGYVVSTALDAETGLAMAQCEHPDVVISDIKMPGMDGYEMLRRLREIPALASTPAIALTGLPQQDKLEISSGYQAVMAKPVDVNELSEVIQQLARPQGS